MSTPGTGPSAPSGTVRTAGIGVPSAAGKTVSTCMAQNHPRTLTRPSCTVVATRVPSAWVKRPVARPRPPPANGE